MADVKKNDIVQIIPKADELSMFNACLFIVDEVSDWGVVCYMINPNGSIIPYRADSGEFVVVGHATYLVEVS